jgi:hypothetical protein
MRSVILLFLCFTVSSLTIYAQNLKTIYARGGDGRNVNWPAIKIQEEKDKEGPGFFYNPCSQGIETKRASSTLAAQGSKSYSITNLGDYNPMTAWVEGKSDYGISEYFEIKSLDITSIHNGYQSSPSNWRNNSRVKKFKIYKDNYPICYLVLTDEMGGQYFDLPINKDYDFDNPSTFRFEIVEVYPGEKWSDVAISEVDFSGCCFSTNTTIYSNNGQIGFDELGTHAQITTIDLNTNETQEAEIVKLNSQIHTKLYQISTATKSIDITVNHPIYVKNLGFVSIARLQTIFKTNNFKDLINHVEVLTYNSETKATEYETLTGITEKEGRFETFTISEVSSVGAYIANGFITAIYK